nr:hypothetical protein BaRGS_014219 [Batillaria attramentaria]
MCLSSNVYRGDYSLYIYRDNIHLQYFVPAHFVRQSRNTKSFSSGTGFRTTGAQFWQNLIRHYNWGGEDDGLATCVLCDWRLVNVLLFQCHHRVVCYTCVQGIALCPRCNGNIQFYARLD